MNAVDAGCACGTLRLRHAERRRRARAGTGAEDRRQCTDNPNGGPSARHGGAGPRRRLDRLTGASRQVLTEGAVVGMYPCALGASVRLDVRRRMYALRARFELGIGDRRRRWSEQLDHRDAECEESEAERADGHVQSHK
jgi:hypothetical protein